MRIFRRWGHELNCPPAARVDGEGDIWRTAPCKRTYIFEAGTARLQAVFFSGANRAGNSRDRIIMPATIEKSEKQAVIMIIFY